jgi:multidrug resistance protein, MATE family
VFGISVMVRFYRTDWDTIQLKSVEHELQDHVV